ncbi:MAG: hypothetical protein ACI8V5_000352 [Limisphaerales bacterium]|jgi:hypothetical protein
MTASALLKESETLSQGEKLSIAIQLLKDGISEELFGQLRDEIETLIAIERCKRLDAGIDEAIPYDEAMKRAKAAVL